MEVHADLTEHLHARLEVGSRSHSEALGNILISIAPNISACSGHDVASALVLLHKLYIAMPIGCHACLTQFRRHPIGVVEIGFYGLAYGTVQFV